MRDRLTERVGDGIRYDNGEYIITCYPENNNLTPVDKLAAKLCDLEDKIENGAVIVPPCKVGDTVYSIVEGIDLVFVGEVYEYVVGREHFVFRSTRKGYFTLAFTEIDIGKTVFLAREEAEKALAERSGE